MHFSAGFFYYVALVKLFDFVTVVAVWFLCWHLRFERKWFALEKGVPDYLDYSNAGFLLGIVFLLVFHMVGAYRKDRLAFGFRALKKIVEGAFLGTLVSISVLYFLSEVHFSRIYLLLFSGLSLVGILAERMLSQALWNAFEKRFVKKIKVVLVGYGELLEMYKKSILQLPPYPLEIMGQVDSRELLIRLLKQKTPDQIVISFPAEESSRYAELLEFLSNSLFEIKVLPDFGKFSTFTYEAVQENNTPLLYFNRPPIGATDRFMKRLFDIVGAFLFLILFSPLYLLIMARIRFASKGSIFFVQERTGADGRLFNLYKFRSMEMDAERETGAVWAQKDDPRVTSFGRFLRQTSLDEIPQFFNVLKGDMSLVGPRPERPYFVERFEKEIPKYMLRHKMKSGITGWAQVNGWRGNTSIEERIKHDLYYIGHWSIWFDIKILFWTLFRGFVNKNAY